MAPMAELRPAVVALTVHLENGQRVLFEEGEEYDVAATDAPITTLTQFFEYNKLHPAGPHYLYSDMPQHFIWDARYKRWKPRVNTLRFKTLGRLHFLSPALGDVFYLRMLLLHPFSIGKCSFESTQI
jgi:hypothetical protein